MMAFITWFDKFRRQEWATLRFGLLLVGFLVVGLYLRFHSSNDVATIGQLPCPQPLAGVWQGQEGADQRLYYFRPDGCTGTSLSAAGGSDRQTDAEQAKRLTAGITSSDQGITQITFSENDGDTSSPVITHIGTLSSDNRVFSGEWQSASAVIDVPAGSFTMKRLDPVDSFTLYRLQSVP